MLWNQALPDLGKCDFGKLRKFWNLDILKNQFKHMKIERFGKLKMWKIKKSMKNGKVWFSAPGRPKSASGLRFSESPRQTISDSEVLVQIRALGTPVVAIRRYTRIHTRDKKPTQGLTWRYLFLKPRLPNKKSLDSTRPDAGFLFNVFTVLCFTLNEWFKK